MVFADVLEIWVDNFMRPGNMQGGFDWYVSSALTRRLWLEERLPRQRKITVRRAFSRASVGTLDSAHTGPREVFRAAILAGAKALVLGHNHPSGDPTPSSADVHLTRRFTKAGELLGIPVLDHIIIGEASHVSLRERGEIDTRS